MGYYLCVATNRIVIEQSVEDLEDALQSFEKSTKMVLHPVVRETLKESTYGPFRIPFLVSHGSYLFGCFFVPGSSIDGKPDLTRISCVASSDVLLIAVKCAAGNDGVQNSLDAMIRSTIDLADSCAENMLAVLELVLDRLVFHYGLIANELVAAAEGIDQSAIFSSRRAAAELAKSHAKLRIAAGELINIEPIVGAMCDVSAAIEEDRLDLKSDDGSELFEANSEIRCQSLVNRFTQLKVSFNGAARSLSEAQTSLQVRVAELRVRGNRLLVALATLFLTPVILLNLYSQFFAEGQSWSNEFTANFFWVVIISSVIAELVLFRAKKWLR